MKTVSPTSPRRLTPKRCRAVVAVGALATMTTLGACGSKATTAAKSATSGTTSATTTPANTTPANTGPAGKSKSGTTCSTKATNSSAPGVAAAEQAVARAAGTSTTWDGPTTGPKAKQGVSVVFIANTMQNAGDVGVLNGLKQAAAVLGWKFKAIDGASTTVNNLAAFDQALALKPSAIAISSFDPNATASDLLKAKAAGIPVIGNHTGSFPGPNSQYPGLFTNITSNPVTIADVAIDCGIVASNGTAAVTISSCGSEAPICLTKEHAMEADLKTCPGCKVLAVDDYPFEDIDQREAGIASADLQKFGSKLTYMLAINDIYFDAAIPALRATGALPGGPPVMIAAGDGSPAAFQRIRTSQYQIATVAEPLNEHGWQMADEINRALNGDAPSTFVTYPHLVTISNVNVDGGAQNTFDPPNEYRQQYEKIWGVG